MALNRPRWRKQSEKAQISVYVYTDRVLTEREFQTTGAATVKARDAKAVTDCVCLVL